MAKINRKAFVAGYAKDEASVKESAADKMDKIKEIEARDAEIRNRYKAKVLDIPYEDIIPNPKNRNADRNIDELADNIYTFGLIHYPRVKADGNGKFILTSGERRWRAIGLIRKEHPEMYKTVPCTYGEADDDDIDEEARLIIANNEVCVPSPEEYRESIKRLGEIYETKKQRGDVLPNSITAMIAEDLSISQRQVQKLVSINNKLIPELQVVFDKEGINVNEAANISQLDPIVQEELLKLFNGKGSIEGGDIAYFKSEDARLKRENADQKDELDRLRAELKELKAAKTTFDMPDSTESSDEDQSESIDSRIETYENTIDELTKALKKSMKTAVDGSDTGKHMVFQDTIARLERAQNNAYKQSKGLKLNDIERKRLENIIEQLTALLG